MKWRECQVADFVDAGKADIQTGPFGTQLKASEYVSEGTPVINVRNIGLGSLIPEKLEFVNDEVGARLSAHLLQSDDIVFGRRGAVDRHLFVGPQQENWIQGSDCMRLRFHTADLSPRFISFAFRTETHRQWMMTQANNKATMAGLNHDVVRRIPLCLPPLPIQQRIADILSAYDDAIENNRRRIKLLEDAARHLYEEWFVRLRFPGHERVRIKDGVPEGWERTDLSRVATVNETVLPASYEGDIEYIDIASVTPGSIDKTTLYDFREAPGRARRIVRHGDIIWSCVRPNRRSHAVIWRPAENLVASTGFAVITPTGLPTSYLYHAVTTHEFVGNLENRAKGAAYPAVVASDFESSQVITPGNTLVAAFDDFVRPSLNLMHVLRMENRQFAAARDVLLPKLMTGEIAA